MGGKGCQVAPDEVLEVLRLAIPLVPDEALIEPPDDVVPPLEAWPLLDADVRPLDADAALAELAA